MNIGLYLLAAVAAYLIGNLQSAVIISRLRYKDDVRNHGSGNAGSTNMLRVFGLKSGALTFAGDLLKGVIAVLAGRWIAGENGGYLAAFFVALGHCYPVFLQFRGGKGVASSLGVAWMLNPLLAAIMTVWAALMVVLTRTISIVSLSGITLYFLLTLIFSWGNWLLIACIGSLWLLIVLRHADNIKRLLKGEESRILEKKPGKKENETDQNV
ncbi:MAG TPA: glycerol-3-phosphate 1-O-acyltransferase PlsY [Feifaniaceae bacterium]|nr:glycerol-3-phosphate 1-O-acyltransferase PlsY [Feifaniaceae bacterium]